MKPVDLWCEDVSEKFAKIIHDTPDDDIPRVVFGENPPIFWMALGPILRYKPFNQRMSNNLKERIVRSICENGYFQITTTYDVDWKDIPEVCLWDFLPNVRWYHKDGKWNSAIPTIKYVYPEESILQDVAGALQYKNPKNIIVRVLNTNWDTPDTISSTKSSVRILGFEGASGWLEQVYDSFKNLANPYKYWLDGLKEPEFDSILVSDY